MSRIVTSNSDKLPAPQRLRRVTAQARCDAIQAAFRGGGAPVSLFREPPPRPDPLELTDDPLQLRLAEELDYAARMLALMGDDLAADMGVVIRHSVALQSIDIVGQMLGHIASVVRSLDPDAAVDRIGMGDLKGRLVRKGSV